MRTGGQKSNLLIVWLGLVLAIGAHGQESTGRADIVFQGYYWGGNATQALQTTGAAIGFEQFLPAVGILRGCFQGYRTSGDTAFGDNYLELNGLPWAGRKWTFTGGDLMVGANPLQNPFSNAFTPDLNVRGARVTVTNSSNSTFTIFGGGETVLQGPRLPFRVKLPQQLFGLQYAYHPRSRWQVAVRYLHVSTDLERLDPQRFYVPPTQFAQNDTVMLQSSCVVSRHLRLFGETAFGEARGKSMNSVPEPGKGSVLLGPVWDSETLTMRANYYFQSPTYMPVIGYFVGDRTGLLTEARYRPRSNVELFGTVNQSSSNVQKNGALPSFRNSSFTSGMSVVLPWRLNGSIQGSIARLETQSPELGMGKSENVQILGTLTRSFRRHNLRATMMGFRLSDAAAQLQHQRSYEVEDMLIWSHFSFGGALRLQQTATSEDRNSLLFRGSFQAHLGRMTAYANAERGNDFVNRTLFARNSFTSTVAGIQADVTRSIGVSFEAFKNNLTMQLNPANVFLLAANGADLPTTLSSMNQWSTYFKVSKHIQWGKRLDYTNIEAYAARQTPLVGWIEGLVLDRAAANAPVGGIPVALDQTRIVLTDTTGHFRFRDVAEGLHRVGLVQRELPADFDPGQMVEASVPVKPRALSRQDFDVIRLATISGRITGPADLAAENLLVRLSSGQYTTPDTDGTFSFYNLRPGTYDVVFDQKQLPAEYELQSPSLAQVELHGGEKVSSIAFQVHKRVVQKPAKVLFENSVTGIVGATDRKSRTKEPSAVPVGGR